MRMAKQKNSARLFTYQMTVLIRNIIIRENVFCNVVMALIVHH